ncbi:MAG: hypothetical protein SFW35_12950 [Chitinophagales bacterium]|nr:hypothetical protein [Chitinophagales bacterium]
MKHFSPLLLALIVVVAISSCKKDDNTSVDLKYEYFPQDTGLYAIYDADSVTFDDFFNPPLVDTVQFQIKEVVESIFNDNEGRPTMRIERYRRADSTQAWTIWNVWTATRTTTTAERYEDNMRFIKLSFPPKVEKTWDGNAYLQIDETNDFLEGWEYQITKLDQPYSINGINFDSSLTVIQHDEENLIEKTYSEEVYAKGAGLVYKQIMKLEKDVTATFPAGAKAGFIYTIRLREYGQQ